MNIRFSAERTFPQSQLIKVISKYFFIIIAPRIKVKRRTKFSKLCVFLFIPYLLKQKHEKLLEVEKARKSYRNLLIFCHRFIWEVFNPLKHDYRHTELLSLIKTFIIHSHDNKKKIKFSIIERFYHRQKYIWVKEIVRKEKSRDSSLLLK